MKKNIFYIAIALLGLIAATYNACSRPSEFSRVYGTVITNPLAPTSKQLLAAICGTITRCQSQVTLNSCQEGVLAAGGFGSQLGLSSSFTTFSQIVSAEQASILVGNPSAADSCSSSISALSCSAPEVQGAYTPGASNPFASAANIIPTTPASGCSSTFSPTISGFSFVDGNGPSGLNYNSSYTAWRPYPAVVNSKLYGIWSEANGPSGPLQIRAKVYNGNDSAPVWNFIDGNSASGINYDVAKTAEFPQAISLNSKLYSVWAEMGSNSVHHIRAKVYNGNDSAPSWSLIDGGGPNGLNVDTTLDASWLGTTVFNNQLYAAWEEGTDNAAVHVKVYNGNDLAPSWTDVSGSTTGITSDPTKQAWEPRMTVVNSKLYMAWGEYYNGTKQIRAAVFNGNNASPNWSMIDGGAPGGLNKNASYAAQAVGLGGFNNKLYVGWVEENAAGVYQLRISVYNGNDSAPAWTFVDGNGANGLNFDSNEKADKVSFMSFNSKLYVTWTEGTNYPKTHIYVAVYNGNDSAPTWSFIGNGAGGVNHDPNQFAFQSQWVIFNSKLYMLWGEENGTPTNIRAAVGH